MSKNISEGFSNWNSEFRIQNSELNILSTFRKISILICLTIIFTVSSTQAQFIEDALRISQPNAYYTPRAGGLGVAFHGISDDFGALMYNPAGLSLVAKNEVSLGFGFLRNSNETEFFKSIMALNSNNAYVSQAGIVSPFKTKYGNAAFAIGYFRESNYNNDYKYSGFNTNNTFTNYMTRTGSDSINENMGSYLYLAGRDKNGKIVTPITDNLQQTAFVRENGGMHNITGGAGFELSEFVSVGFSLTGKWGNYGYNREYTESDINNKYNENKQDFSMVDFEHLTLNENLEQSISGITGSLGIQARILDFMRISANIKFPTFYDINEDFSQTATAYFDNGEHIEPTWQNTGSTSYKVTSPWVYCAGISGHFDGITISYGIEYTDVSQLEFNDATPLVMGLNNQILQYYFGQLTWGMGVEYELPFIPMVVRGSFTGTSSPLKIDVSGATLINVALGAGIYLAPNIRLDGLFRWSAFINLDDWTDLSQLRTNFGSDPIERYILNTKPLNLGLQLTYRY